MLGDPFLYYFALGHRKLEFAMCGSATVAPERSRASDAMALISLITQSYTAST